MRLLETALRDNDSQSLTGPVGESPTVTGPDGIGMLPSNVGHGFEISGLRVSKLRSLQ